MSERTKIKVEYGIMYIGFILIVTSIIYSVCSSGVGLL